ncbi:MAG: 50S ribosomal protein L4 [Planctomycetes bacterium]|nr:50S ribosomal protein L4 [Planctomycetota bacterium]
MSAGAAKPKSPRERRERQVLAPVEVPFFNAGGKPQGSRTFQAGPVANFPNVKLLKEAVRRQQGILRRGTASTRTRGEINASNKKPWRQKGTGRARAGRRSSPIWRGGGIVFGPKPRTYDYGLPRAQRRLAIRHALLSKLIDGESRIIERLAPAETGTSALEKLLRAIGLERSCLIGIEGSMERESVKRLVLSCRNLRDVKVVPISEADALSLLRHRSLLLTEGAFKELQEREQRIGAKG